MIVTTTDSVDGSNVAAYLGIVTGEAVVGANIFRDMFASIRDVVGGRSGSYEKVLAGARDAALEADAIIGVDLDYEVLGKENGMMMVVANGTAVRLQAG